MRTDLWIDPSAASYQILIYKSISGTGQGIILHSSRHPNPRMSNVRVIQSIPLEKPLDDAPFLFKFPGKHNQFIDIKYSCGSWELLNGNDNSHYQYNLQVENENLK